MPINKVMDSVGNTLIDLTDDTITPDKVLQGYTFHDRSGSRQTGILESVPIGRTSNFSEDNVVRFIDYDGEIVAEYSIAEANALTELPTPPSHERLIFEKWNHTLQEVQQTTHSLCVGALYNTVDNATYIEFFLSAGYINSGSTLYFKTGSSVNGNITIDWGDGTVETKSVTSANSNVNYNHIYISCGKYVIKITNDDDIDIWLYFARSGNRAISNLQQVYEINFAKWQGAVTSQTSSIRANESIIFSGFSSLQKFSIPSTCVFSFTDFTYQCFGGLKCIIVPNGFNGVQSTNSYGSNTIKYVSIPRVMYFSSTEPSFAGTAFGYNVKSVIYPDSYIKKSTGDESDSVTIEILFTQGSSCEYIYLPEKNIKSLNINFCNNLKKISNLNRVVSISNFTSLYSLEEEIIDFSNITSNFFNMSNWTHQFKNVKIVKLSSNIQSIQFSQSLCHFECLDLSTIETPPTLSSLTPNSINFKIKVMHGTLSLYAAATNWSTLYAYELLEEATE